MAAGYTDVYNTINGRNASLTAHHKQSIAESRARAKHHCKEPIAESRARDKKPAKMITISRYESGCFCLLYFE